MLSMQVSCWDMFVIWWAALQTLRASSVTMVLPASPRQWLPPVTIGAVRVGMATDHAVAGDIRCLQKKQERLLCADFLLSRSACDKEDSTTVVLPMSPAEGCRQRLMGRSASEWVPTTSYGCYTRVCRAASSSESISWHPAKRRSVAVRTGAACCARMGLVRAQ